jgi:phosphomannomutase
MTLFDPREWLAAEPDEDLRQELSALLADRAPEAVAELADRFSGPLTFGTAGLRGPVAAGPRRMNRLVVRQAAAGLIDHLLATTPDVSGRGLLIGFDARRKSEAFAWDTARVAAARGVRARLFPQVVPTPVLAWSVPHLAGAAGVMVTASHNPPADNGYKVYLADGSQIVDPLDTAIAACIAGVDALTVPLSDADDPLIEVVDMAVIDGYVASVAALRRRPDVAGVRVAYTALHGVGGELILRAFAGAGFPAPAVAAGQQQPDGTFPTVSFPNPEEPGAMDAVIELARHEGLTVALANDPDADRLGVAIETRNGTWRRLTGDEIGWLLADHVLTTTTPAPGTVDRRLVVTTMVSSSLLARMAAHHGAQCVETFTGFKWIARTAREHPDLEFVFGYEQALGYLVGREPLDKDGIGAAIVFSELVALAATTGHTVEDRLDDLARQFGHHITAERSIRLEPDAARQAVAQLQAEPPTSIGGQPVVAVEEYPQANLIRFLVGDPTRPVRLQVRPSGTEPKVKLYGEAVGSDPAALLDALSSLLLRDTEQSVPGVT